MRLELLTLVLTAMICEALGSSASGTQAVAGCELHVWPAERMTGRPEHLGQIMIGRATADEINTAMSNLVGPAAQLAALRDADLVNQLRLPPETKIVEHENPLDRKTVNKIKMRRSTSSSPCYYELIVMQHALIEDVVWGDRFLSTFMFRDFGDAKVARTIHKSNGGNKLKVLTQNADKRHEDASGLVAAAIQGNFRESAPGLRGRGVEQSPSAGT